MIPAAAVLLAASLSATASDDVVARVGDVQITRGEVEARLREFANPARTPAGAAAWALVDEVLLAQDARRQGLERDREYAHRVDIARVRLAARLFLEREFAGGDVPEDVLRNMYHATGDSARVNILRYTTREDAAGAAARLGSGGDVAAEAERSLDPGAARTAAHLIRAQMEPPLAEAVFRASPGAIVGPIELRLGWVVVKVEGTVVADEAGYAARRPALLANAQGQASELRRKHFVEQVRKRSKVVVDDKFITSLGRRVEVARGELDHVVAVADGRSLPYRDFLTSFRWLAAGGRHFAGPGTKLQIVQQTVDEILVGADAIARNYATPEIDAAQPSMQRRALAELLSERVRANAPKPTEKEIRKAYRSSNSPEPLDEVREDIAARLWAPRQAEKLGALTASLRSRASIVVDEAALARIQK